MAKHYTGKYIKRDLIIVALSIILAVVLFKSGLIEDVVSLTDGATYVGTFVAGLFFTSAFTIAPAAIALAKIAEHQSALSIALVGATGAMIGDLIIFLFIRDTVTDDIEYMSKKFKFKKILASLHLGFLRIISPAIGALIIASPLPDELGLTLMGLSRVRTIVVIPIAFCMNIIGILSIIAVARVL